MIPALFTVIIPALPLNVVLAAVLFGVAYATLALVLQRKLSNPKKTRELQQRINALTKEMNEMAKRNEDISAKQQELMPLISESMKSQMKSMFVVLPMFLVIYYLVIPAIFSAYSAAALNFILPLSTSNLFIVSAIVFGLVLSISILIRDRIAAKNLAKMQAQVSNNPK